MNPLTPTSPDPLTQFLSAELASAVSRWETLIPTVTDCPAWDWEEVNEALLSFTTCPAQELVVRGALSGLVKQARFKPPAQILEELLRLAIAAHDLGFRRSAQQMLEAEMP